MFRWVSPFFKAWIQRLSPVGWVEVRNPSPEARAQPNLRLSSRLQSLSCPPPASSKRYGTRFECHRVGYDMKKGPFDFVGVGDESLQIQ